MSELPAKVNPETNVITTESQGYLGNPPPYPGPPQASSHQAGPPPGPHLPGPPPGPHLPGPLPGPQPVGPQHGYYAFHDPSTTAVIHTVRPNGQSVSTVIVSRPIGPEPARITCRSCQQAIETSVTYRPSAQAHICALMLCLIGCWPFMCLPYCMGSCQNAEHYCPNCNAFVGSYHS